MTPRVAILLAVAGCVGGGESADPKGGDSASETAATTDSDSAVDSDTEELPRECDPVQLAPPPLASAGPLCGGLLGAIEVADVGGGLVASENGYCDGVTEGAIFGVAPDSTTPLWLVPTEDARQGLAMEVTRGGQGLVAVDRYGADGAHGGAVDIRDAATGELLSNIHRADDDAADGKIDILWSFAFADDRLVIGDLGGQDGPDSVAVFEPPWVASVAWRDAAVAVHPQPDGTCCGFGEITRAVGDVTGDGIEDIVVMGGGSWVLDGATLTLDDGDAFPFDPGGYLYHQAITGVGDVDGDGIGDFSTSYADQDEDGKAYVQITQGGTLTELARITDERSGGFMGDYVAGVGRLDGATTDSFVVVWSSESGMAEGGDEIWLVSGPLCGSFILEEVATEVEVPSTSYVTAISGADGFLAAIDESDGAGYLFGAL